MDIIYLSGLKIDTVIGIYDWERRIKQTIALDLEMAFDIRQAAESDDITHTLDYKAVSKRLIAFVSESRFQLVETLIERVAEIVLNEFKVSWVRVKLNKSGALRHTDAVGIIIERGVKS